MGEHTGGRCCQPACSLPYLSHFLFSLSLKFCIRFFSSLLCKTPLVYCYLINRTSLIAQFVKNPPAMQETLVRYLGQEDPLEKGVATYSGIVAWNIPWTEEHDGLQSMGL